MPRSVQLCDSLDELSEFDYMDTRDLRELHRMLENQDDLDDEQIKLRDALRELAEEIYLRATLVRESYWEKYCRQEASELGFLKDLENNPLEDCIDWDKWADKVRQDYRKTTIGDVTYYYREV
jgi:hypothetical protein